MQQLPFRVCAPACVPARAAGRFGCPAALTLPGLILGAILLVLLKFVLFIELLVAALTNYLVVLSHKFLLEFPFSVA